MSKKEAHKAVERCAKEKSRQTNCFWNSQINFWYNDDYSEAIYEEEEVSFWMPIPKDPI